LNERVRRTHQILSLSKGYKGIVRRCPDVAERGLELARIVPHKMAYRVVCSMDGNVDGSMDKWRLNSDINRGMKAE